MELNFFASSPLHLLGLEAMSQGIKVAGIGGFFFCLCYSLKFEAAVTEVQMEVNYNSWASRAAIFWTLMFKNFGEVHDFVVSPVVLAWIHSSRLEITTIPALT
jgi:hypothetical protein